MSNSFSIKINKDITKIKDNLVLGLDLRTSVFMIATLCIGGFTFISLGDYTENIDIRVVLTSVVVAPFALLTFTKYQGLTAEKLLMEFIHSEMLPHTLVMTTENSFYQAVIAKRNKRIKEDLKNDKIAKKKAKREKRTVPQTEEHSESDSD